MKTIGIDEAASIARVHRETLKARIMAGDIRAAKLGKRWIFIEEDFMEDLRRLYYKKKSTDKITGEVSWQSICPKTTDAGELDLPHQVESEYNALLVRQTKGRRKNSMTN